MSRGRKPIPEEIKKATGNPGKRPLDVDKLCVPAQMPEKPDWLNGEGRKEWDRITAELMELGLLLRVDRAALAMYCRYYQRWVTAEKHLNTATGFFSTTPNGFRIQSNYLNIANKAAEMCLKLMGEFGMTPSSRTKLAIIKSGGEQGDLFDGWLSGGGADGPANNSDMPQA